MALQLAYDAGPRALMRQPARESGPLYLDRGRLTTKQWIMAMAGEQRCDGPKVKTLEHCFDQLKF
jgi:hypothetical protein